MRALIPPSRYVSAQVFSLEQKQLFARTWQFVGTNNDLANHNDFLACTIAGHSVVVQNFEGELRAFENICRHRHSIIQCERRGNRSLTCPYHGWRYDREGLACGIPSRPRFNEADLAASDALRLKSYALARCGTFLFVRVTPDGPDLEDYLGSAADVLRSLSTGLGERIDTFELNELTNWKVAVENTLEFYHVGLIHRTSFARLGAAEREQHFQGPHSQALAAIPADDNTRRHKLMDGIAARPFACDGYLHQFVFPNLTVATTQGASFSVQFFEPVAPGVTRFVSHVYATLAGNASRSPTAAAIAQQTAQFNRDVFSEDQVVCELVQRGLAETADERRGVLSSEEARVEAFQRAYMELMGSY